MNNNYVSHLLSMSRVSNNSKAKEYSKKKTQRVALNKRAHADFVLLPHCICLKAICVCVRVASVQDYQEDYHSISFVPVCEPSKPVITGVVSDLRFLFPQLLLGLAKSLFQEQMSLDR